MAITVFSWRVLHWLWRIPVLVLLLLILLLIVFRSEPVTISSFIVQQQFQHWRNPEIPAPRQQWVELDAMSPQVLLAVIAAEDQLFPVHKGIDWQATQQAIQAALQGHQAGGGSTITQQVAKNLFLWSGRSYVRKGLEWCLALLLEVLWSKERILEVYLNIAQFSDTDYGVGAASQYLLGKPVSALSASEAALLAAVLPAPGLYKVNKPSSYVKNRQRFIFKQMRQLGGVNYLLQLTE